MTADELKAKIDLEGDRKDFTYKEHERRVLRMPITGHLCGYVGVCVLLLLFTVLIMDLLIL